MRFLVNENVTSSVIAGLRKRGHEVLSVKESMRSENDDRILARAQAEQWIVVTHDKDFGELAFRCGLPADSGVILFRLSTCDRDTTNVRILEALETRTDWAGHFSVVSDDRIRVRPLSVPPKAKRAEREKPKQDE